MLGTTVYISTDVAATPLLWILPLSIYLFALWQPLVKNLLFPLRLWREMYYFL